MLGERTFLNAHPEIVGPTIPLASICGRINALVEAGLVRVARVDVDRRTGHRVEVLEAVEPARQLRMFESFGRGTT